MFSNRECKEVLFEWQGFKMWSSYGVIAGHLGIGSFLGSQKAFFANKGD